jgi:hypothetical protein
MVQKEWAMIEGVHVGDDEDFFVKVLTSQDPTDSFTYFQSCGNQ